MCAYPWLVSVHPCGRRKDQPGWRPAALPATSWHLAAAHRARGTRWQAAIGGYPRPAVRGQQEHGPQSPARVAGGWADRHEPGLGQPCSEPRGAAGGLTRESPRRFRPGALVSLLARSCITPRAREAAGTPPGRTAGPGCHSPGTTSQRGAGTWIMVVVTGRPPGGLGWATLPNRVGPRYRVPRNNVKTDRV